MQDKGVEDGKIFGFAKLPELVVGEGAVFGGFEKLFKIAVGVAGLGGSVHVEGGVDAVPAHFKVEEEEGVGKKAHAVFALREDGGFEAHCVGHARARSKSGVVRALAHLGLVDAILCEEPVQDVLLVLFDAEGFSLSFFVFFEGEGNASDAVGGGTIAGHFDGAKGVNGGPQKMVGEARLPDIGFDHVLKMASVLRSRLFFGIPLAARFLSNFSVVIGKRALDGRLGKALADKGIENLRSWASMALLD